MSEFITTYTGKHFKPTDPDAELIDILDIAHALSLLCRGNGHVKTFWSVGEHCICCAKEAAARGLPDRMVLACLLHDASECYMSDVPSPFKKALPKYQEQEAYLLHLIYEKFLGSDLTTQEQAQLEEIDHAMLLIWMSCFVRSRMVSLRSFILSWIIPCGLLWKWKLSISGFLSTTQK